MTLVAPLVDRMQHLGKGLAVTSGSAGMNHPNGPPLPSSFQDRTGRSTDDQLSRLPRGRAVAGTASLTLISLTAASLASAVYPAWGARCSAAIG